MYLISDDNFVFMHDVNTLKEKNVMSIPLRKSDT